ncbi:hypothetical protein NHX12_005721 [Muraenolepis orangiensis]|uniref:Uncharacterized protein n=1 Tax=Muraenolepis orangiensis TaxID=630683 RepID=A0A9Q0DTE9_9TELE|nr:hypothetical protein NHX12_005721 [Muraenolepis orangiensis]
MDQSKVSILLHTTVLTDVEWVTVLSDFQQRDTKWGFAPGVPGRPLALHLGDYNLDGFPDALVILRNSSSSDRTGKRRRCRRRCSPAPASLDQKADRPPVSTAGPAVDHGVTCSPHGGFRLRNTAQRVLLVPF